MNIKREDSTAKYQDNVNDPSDATNPLARRPAFSVSAPALVPHLCIRLKNQNSPVDQTAGAAPADGKQADRPGGARYATALNAVIAALNEHFAKFQKNRRTDEQYRFDVYGKNGNGRNVMPRTDTIFFETDKREGYRLRVRADIHIEYVTITYIADKFSDAADNAIFQLERNIRAGKLNSRETADKACGHAFEEFWAPSDDLPSIFPRTASDEGIIDPFKDADVFADLRGFVARGAEFSAVLEDEFPLPVKKKRSAQPEASRLDEQLADMVTSNTAFISSALGLSDAPSKDVVNHDANVVLCGVLDGAAIYGSDLGQTALASEAKDPAHARMPSQSEHIVRYFLFFNGKSHAQLGRLIRRFHVLGELRMAALFDIKALRDSSHEIRILGADMSHAPRNSPAQELDQPQQATKENAGWLDENVLNGFNLRFLRIGVKCLGGLIYRINRSRYFAQSYRERLQDLRIVRIEGWQPYAEFMRRNLFMEFDYISQIGDRHTALGRRIERETAVTQTMMFRQYYMSVRRNTDQLTDIQENQLLPLQTEAKIIADVVGAGAFTYYAGHVAADLAGWLGDLAAGYGSGIPAVARVGSLLASRDEHDPTVFALQPFWFIAMLVLFLYLKELIQNREAAKNLAQKKARA